MDDSVMKRILVGCGLYDCDEEELEYLMEEVVLECCSVVQDRSTKADPEDLVAEIKRHFGMS